MFPSAQWGTLALLSTLFVCCGGDFWMFLDCLWGFQRCAFLAEAGCGFLVAGALILTHLCLIIISVCIPWFSHRSSPDCFCILRGWSWLLNLVLYLSENSSVSFYVIVLWLTCALFLVCLQSSSSVFELWHHRHYAAQPQTHPASCCIPCILHHCFYTCVFITAPSTISYTLPQHSPALCHMPYQHPPDSCLELPQHSPPECSLEPEAPPAISFPEFNNKFIALVNSALVASCYSVQCYRTDEM